MSRASGRPRKIDPLPQVDYFNGYSTQGSKLETLLHTFLYILIIHALLY